MFYEDLYIWGPLGPLGYYPGPGPERVTLGPGIPGPGPGGGGPPPRCSRCWANLGPGWGTISKLLRVLSKIEP